MDLALLDARVLTVDRAGRRAEAIAVQDGRIAAIGASPEIERLAGPETRVLRLGGRAVVPGFVDPHTHFSMTTLEPVAVDCGSPPHESVQNIVAAVAAMATSVPAGRWIRGWDVRPRLLREGATARQVLQETAPARGPGVRCTGSHRADPSTVRTQP